MLTRAKLYEQVWAAPVSTVARELGISDVALAKACRKHSIPTPPRGHWQRLEAGQTVKRAPLPPLRGEKGPKDAAR